MFTKSTVTSKIRGMRKPERLLGIADIARELGVDRQVIHNRRERDPNYLPAPSFVGPKGARLWRRRTLEQSGVLDRK